MPSDIGVRLLYVYDLGELDNGKESVEQLIAESVELCKL